MMTTLKKIIPHSLYLIMHDRKIKKQWKNELEHWNILNDKSKIPAPHIIKQQIISNYQKKYGIYNLIETGSYFGDMIEAQKNNFNDLWTIELSKDLFQFVRKRFKNNSNINCLHGDSGKLLNEIVPQLKSNSIFWLDGHYSGGVTAKGELECPIFEEMKAIINSKYDNIVLIDDAREFVGERDYPTIEELKDFLNRNKVKFQMEISDDVIRVLFGDLSYL